MPSITSPAVPSIEIQSPSWKTRSPSAVSTVIVRAW
jgi:hypothetical protein